MKSAASQTTSKRLDPKNTVEDEVGEYSDNLNRCV